MTDRAAQILAPSRPHALWGFSCRAPGRRDVPFNRDTRPMQDYGPGAGCIPVTCISGNVHCFSLQELARRMPRPPPAGFLQAALPSAGFRHFPPPSSDVEVTSCALVDANSLGACRERASGRLRIDVGQRVPPLGALWIQRLLAQLGRHLLEFAVTRAELRERHVRRAHQSQGGADR